MAEIVRQYMDSEVIKKYLEAGRIAHSALKKAIDLVEPGRPVLDICEELEREIKNYGGKPAFPVNVSINNIAAHYTADVNDITKIPKKGIIKVDVGVHVDGYIADTAISITLGDEFLFLAKASRYALKDAWQSLRPGIRLGKIGDVIEKRIKSFGYTPISNLSGHSIERYKLHAGKSIPNVSELGMERVKENEVYAIEPFATNGYGEVIAGDKITIYQIISLKRIRRNLSLTEKLKELWKKYGFLPFAKRWIIKDIEENAFNELVKHRRVYGYPILLERNEGFVSQTEDTFIVLENETINTTRSVELLQ